MNDVQKAIVVADARRRVVPDDVAGEIASWWLRLDGDEPLRRVTNGEKPSTLAGWRAVRDRVAALTRENPRDADLPYLQAWVVKQMACEQCDDGAIVPGVLAGTNTSADVEECDVCLRFDGPLAAAYALAQAVGGEVKFWQHDAELLADVEAGWASCVDLAAAGFTTRTYALATERADDTVLSGTNPWIEIDKRPVDWWHVRAVLEATRRSEEC